MGARALSDTHASGFSLLPMHRQASTWAPGWLAWRLLLVGSRVRHLSGCHTSGEALSKPHTLPLLHSAGQHNITCATQLLAWPIFVQNVATVATWLRVRGSGFGEEVVHVLLQSPGEI